MTKFRILSGIIIIFSVLVITFVHTWQPVYAVEDSIYPLEGQETINFGNQGLFINTRPANAAYVELKKHKSPLPDELLYGARFIYEEPAIEVTFLDSNKVEVEPWSTPNSVYFNIRKKTTKKWFEHGSDVISIWYYNRSTRIWNICPTRFIAEKENNGEFDRLACFVMGNGIYVVGEMEIDEYVRMEGPQTINLGKQGLFISNPPPNVYYVKIERIHPPIPAKFTFDIDLAYRGPALKIQFTNQYKRLVQPVATLTSVYFNVSEPEVRMWNEGGADAIAIWYYNVNSKEWRMCPTRFIPERQDNLLYDRLACYVMGNGYYVLGKMEFDPVFPLWFKLQGEELTRRNRFVQDY